MDVDFFLLGLDAETLARHLAASVYPDGFVDPEIPFPQNGSGHMGDSVDRGDRHWWQLSMANDHTLHASPRRGQYTYRDRYGEPGRVARIRAKLRTLGATDPSGGPL